MSGQLRSIALALPGGVPAAARHLEEVVPLPVQVEDGERWLAYAPAPVSLALAGADELPAGVVVSLNVKVADAAAAHRELVGRGLVTASPPQAGAHEVRASVWLADGVALTVYSPLS